MADIGTGTTKANWVREITGYQWLVLFVAWAGWSLDITDFTLYGLVLRQAITELLGGNPSLAEIGRVVEGSVRRGGNRVRISAQLIEAETGTHLWADRFDGSL